MALHTLPSTIFHDACSPTLALVTGAVLLLQYSPTLPIGGLCSPRGNPRVVSHRGVKVVELHAEHCILDVSSAERDLALGERVLLQPFYSDATIFLHREAHGVVRDASGKWRVERTFDLTQSIGALQ